MSVTHSRRSVLAALAAAPAASVPALAGVAATSEPDPIFLAIERIATPITGSAMRC